MPFVVVHLVNILQQGIHTGCCVLQVVFMNVYDVMIKAVMVVPRVETKLYSEWVSYLCHTSCPLNVHFEYCIDFLLYANTFSFQ